MSMWGEHVREVADVLRAYDLLDELKRVRNDFAADLGEDDERVRRLDDIRARLRPALRLRF